MCILTGPSSVVCEYDERQELCFEEIDDLTGGFGAEAPYSGGDAPLNVGESVDGMAGLAPLDEPCSPSLLSVPAGLPDSGRILIREFVAFVTLGMVSGDDGGRTSVAAMCSSIEIRVRLLANGGDFLVPEFPFALTEERFAMTGFFSLP